MKRFLVFGLVCSIVFIGCNKPGCTDANAVNYDSSANDEDGTCQYVPTLSTMPIIYDGESLFADAGGVITSDGGSDVTVRGICWSTFQNSTTVDDTTINGSGTGQFTSRLENLEFSTTYYVRAYATNSNGTAYGNEFSFSTPGYTLIPDQNFEQALIDLGHDNVLDGRVLTDNISSVDSLIIGFPLIFTDLTGIEDFTSLEYLDCDAAGAGQLMSLDLSQNTALKYLNCAGNSLINLNLSGCTALTFLQCNSNQITSLDLSQNTSLTVLICSSNQLTSLDVTQNTLLTELYCFINQIISLDVSQNTSLTDLSCGNNQLTSLDVSQNTSLIDFGCYDNQLTCLNLKNGNNTAITHFASVSNANLFCIEVDDPNYSTQNWTYVDTGVTFSTNCNYPAGCF